MCQEERPQIAANSLDKMSAVPANNSENIFITIKKYFIKNKFD